MFYSVATYPEACPDSSHFESSLAHLAVGMTLLNASLFEQVDSTFSVLCIGHSAAFLIYKGALAECSSSDFKKGQLVLNPSPKCVHDSTYPSV